MRFAGAFHWAHTSYFWRVFSRSSRSLLQIYVALPIIHVEFLQMDLSASSKISVLKNVWWKSEHFLTYLCVCGWNFLILFFKIPAINSNLITVYGGTHQKLEVFAWWNDLAKRFKICRVLYIWKPKIAFSIFLFVLLNVFPIECPGHQGTHKQKKIK